MTNYFPDYTHHLRSISEHKTNFFLPLILAGLLFVTGACEEPPSLIGTKLLPGSDFVTIHPSLLPVKSYTMFRDSIASSMPSNSYLGSISDPYFGTTTCEFVSQIRLGSEWDSEEDFYVDSVKLFLKLLTVKGDTASQHLIRLSEIADRIYNDSIYYSSQPVAVTPWFIPDIHLPVLRRDTINDIEMVVDNSFASYIFRDTSKLKYTTYVDFRDYFRGLYFQMISPDNPMLVSLSCASPSIFGSYANYFEIYGNNGNGTSRTFILILDAISTNACFNLYRHNHPPTLNHINDTSYLDTLSYAEQFNGLYTRLVFPTLSSIRDTLDVKNISVNKARLKIPMVYAPPYYTRSNIPATLFLRYMTASGSRYYVPETNTTFYNGTADTTAANETDDVYNLNIATFIQGYLNDKTNEILPELELFLLPDAGNNVVLKANDSYKPIKFEFTYTKF